MHRFVLHNGDIVDARQKTLSAGQVGLLTGWGVFTTMRVADGVLFAFERHWQRMHQDALRMHVPFPADAGRLKADLLKLAEANHATTQLCGWMWCAIAADYSRDRIKRGTSTLSPSPATSIRGVKACGWG